MNHNGKYYDGELAPNDTFHDVGNFCTPQNETKRSHACAMVWVHEAKHSILLQLAVQFLEAAILES